MLRNFTREKQITQLVLLATSKHILDDCGVIEAEATRIVAYLLSDGFKEVYETYIAHGISSDAHFCHGTCQAVINALMQHFLTKDVLREARELENRCLQRSGDDKQEFGTRIFKGTRQFRHLFTAMKKPYY